MNEKTTTWVATIGVAALTGLLTLYVSVKNAALKYLNKQGAFDEAIFQRSRDLLYASDGLDAATPVPAEETQDSRTEIINQEFKARKKHIIQGKGADNFAGAWKILPQEEKIKTLGFAAINSIVAGALTHSVANAARKSGGKGGGSRSDGGCGYAGCSYGGGFHDGGGHGCGYGCGH